MTSQSDRNSRRRKPESPAAEWEPSATGFDLTAQELRTETAAEIRPLEIRAAEMPMVEFGQSAPVELRPDEHRYEFVKPGDVEFALRKELAREIEMLAVPLTPFEMRALRERRIAARDLGWKVPGLRIRVE